MANKTKFTAEEIIQALKSEMENSTIEGQLLRTKLIRELYKQVGEPKEEDFKDVFKHARYWKKVAGYTKDIDYLTARHMELSDSARTDWCITYPSVTKREIVEDYTRDGWHCTVQAYNVCCSKHVKHPRYKNLWVRFYCTRDCSKYEYIIEKDTNE